MSPSLICQLLGPYFQRTPFDGRFEETKDDIEKEWKEITTDEDLEEAEIDEPEEEDAENQRNLCPQLPSLNRGLGRPRGCWAGAEQKQPGNWLNPK